MTTAVFSQRPMRAFHREGPRTRHMLELLSRGPKNLRSLIESAGWTSRTYHTGLGAVDALTRRGFVVKMTNGDVYLTAAGRCLMGLESPDDTAARVADCEETGHQGFTKTALVGTEGTVRGFCRLCGAEMDVTVSDQMVDGEVRSVESFDYRVSEAAR